MHRPHAEYALTAGRVDAKEPGFLDRCDTALDDGVRDTDSPEGLRSISRIDCLQFVFQVGSAAHGAISGTASARAPAQSRPVHDLLSTLNEAYGGTFAGHEERVRRGALHLRSMRFGDHHWRRLPFWHTVLAPADD